MPPVNNNQWRSLQQGDPAEFPGLAWATQQPESRRQVLRLLAASLALGPLAGCDPAEPDGHLVPAVKQPPQIVAGRPNRYATASLACGDVAGVIVTHRMGRPVKVEGNPAHPASLGATDIHGQAMILDFYDPDRGVGVLQAGQIASEPALQTALAAERSRLAATQGAGFRILSARSQSPSLDAAMARLLRRYPQARWHQWDPVSRDAVRAGVRLAYGVDADIIPLPEQADVLLALDSDLISSAPGHLAHARGIASRRNPVRTSRVSRIYAAETTPSLIGTMADHRAPAGLQEIAAGLRAIAARVLDSAATTDAPRWATLAADDLLAAGPHALVHAGPDLPPELHALTHHINEKLGARNTSFRLIAPQAATSSDADEMTALIAAMQAGQVDQLLVLDSNPCMTAPGFIQALAKVRFSLAGTLHANETARATSWFVPLSHSFESWGDARAFDGTASILQPQALPLFGGRSALQIAALFEGVTVNDQQAVRQNWPQLHDDEAWRTALATGLVPGTAANSIEPHMRSGMAATALVDAPALQLLIRPDPNLWDGRYANNPWLQELPRPLTKLTWDNPLLISPAIGRQHDLGHGDMVELAVGDAKLVAPVWIVPGQAANCIVAQWGGGRRAAGAVGNGVGIDILPLIGAQGAVSLKKLGRRVRLASTDHHDPMEAGTTDAMRHATLAAFQKNPDLFKAEPKASIYHSPQTTGTAWGMSIDLNSCIGCNSCVAACQAENNIPVVGKDQVLHQREMHWMRIDRYYEGEADNPDSFFQPMLCQHCEDAPCEVVCPVGATMHDSEGLNVQVYNRCVGTRFCSNNCPYKVRRFNFAAYTAKETRPEISRNPEVTVRARGVMEKCTFCIQRIADVRIEHDRDGTPERAITACQAACPTQAISFGDIRDPDSEVSARKHSPISYAVLDERNTFPRVTYEARIRNPNPASGA